MYGVVRPSLFFIAWDQDRLQRSDNFAMLNSVSVLRMFLASNVLMKVIWVAV